MLYRIINLIQILNIRIPADTLNHADQQTIQTHRSPSSHVLDAPSSLPQSLVDIHHLDAPPLPVRLHRAVEELILRLPLLLQP